MSSTETSTLLDYEADEIVDIALSRLQEIGVELIEWRELVYGRMDVPLVFQDYSYLVPDKCVAEVSAALTELGLPRTPPTKFNISVYGELETQGHFHRITRKTGPTSQHIGIYPRSFAAFADSELEEKPPMHKEFSRCSPILVPTPPAVYASILRLMLRYRKGQAEMFELRSDLSELIGYHLYRLEDGYIDAYNDEVWEGMNMDQRVSDAIQLVRSWSADGLWRTGEEWMGDALAEYVRTGDDKYLRHKPAS
ncbi:hypothetical protein GGX14DRAFT_430698 [Mycena pura]|uniref:Uncharacterized protein n=1 Tax=Mycena pura TaxID=153505 RepID=A0AAD6VTQ3_9AGAR|nr:hypothetical protein GGX14DRAFT_430698 [Mycena pura]